MADNSIACMKNLHIMEDRFMKMPGMYLFWTCLYVAVVGSLGASDVTGASRDFLVQTSLISMIFPALAGANNIFGTKLPSTLLLIGGPIYQYAFWMLLAYHRANVYGSDPVGVMNAVGTGVTGVFTLDMVIKTWYHTININNYGLYVADVNGN